VAASAMSSSLKRVLLELGGNDPAIVMADADIEAAAPKLFRAAFTNSGQVCMAVKRVYVHESRIDELTDKLATLAKAQVLGDGMAPDTTLGPVQNAMQFEKVMELVNDARDAGAEFVTGGHALNRPGYFIAPTIVRGIEDGVRLVDEEQFGPVLPLVAFTDVEDAISRANNSCYGLSASVWTTDAAVGRAIAARLEAGTVWVNKHLEPALDAPFGGAKESGIGRSQGELGAKAYMEPKVIDLIAQA
jgi:acyl-CoA reductase-like NAD-dependent aldehyde dehydrogenase